MLNGTVYGAVYRRALACSSSRSRLVPRWHPGSLLALAVPPRFLVRARRADLRRTHRLGHAEEDHDALAAAARREHLVGGSVATVNVLPVVHHPHVARRRDSEVRLHLQAATDVAVGWGDLVS